MAVVLRLLVLPLTLVSLSALIHSARRPQDYETTIQIFEGSVGCRATLKGPETGPQLGIIVRVLDPTGTELHSAEQFSYSLNVEASFTVEAPLTGVYTCHARYLVNGGQIGERQTQGNILASCPNPTNFRSVGVSYPSIPYPGTLEFHYQWDSSNTNLASLDCELRESVGYNPAQNPLPSPPFSQDDYVPGWGENPYVLPDPPVPGSDGEFFDRLETRQPFVQPYSAIGISRTQKFQYRCKCGGGNFSGWTVIHEPFPNIYREFIQNPNGSWRFETSKSGYTATINPLPQ